APAVRIGEVPDRYADLGLDQLLASADLVLQEMRGDPREDRMGPRVPAHVEPFGGELAKLGPSQPAVLGRPPSRELDARRVGDRVEEIVALGHGHALAALAPGELLRVPVLLVADLERMGRAAMADLDETSGRLVEHETESIGPDPPPAIHEVADDED